MGQRVTQRILECDECKQIPEDGEHLWEMYTDGKCSTVCEDCIDD